jgi:pimeloyl-ACP methyl ester carboxylesterase/DNA-binding CsgD family transcriptional regulator
MSKQPEQRIAFTHSADNTQIAYALSGEGEPLVRAGTWLTHIQYDWESPIWSHWFHLMSERHTLVRYDPRGCGLSERKVTDISLDKWVDDLAAVVDNLELETFPLFGMSQGAAVSIMYALRYPERVSHLTLYAPVVTGWKGSKNAVSLRWAMMEKLVVSGWGEENLAFPSMFAQLFLPDARPEYIRWYAETQKKSTSKDVAVLMMKALSELRLFSLLKQLKVPTLVIQVAGDQVISADQVKGIAGEIPDSRFFSIDSNNHILLESEPGWQEFKKIFAAHIPSGSDSVPAPVSSAPTSNVSKTIEELSKREREVLMQLAKGLSNKEIANAFFISEKTVRNHISNIFAKIGVTSRTQALVLAKELNL